MKILMKIDRKDLSTDAIKRASKKICGNSPTRRDTEKLISIIKLVKK